MTVPIPETQTQDQQKETPKKPWIKLGELDPQASLTPPPRAYPAEAGPAERAAMRFAVRGCAVCKSFSFFFFFLIFEWF